MPIVMDLGFGEDGDAGDRGTVSKQATRGHEVYPGSGPRRENPTPAFLLLITAKPVITGVTPSESAPCKFQRNPPNPRRNDSKVPTRHLRAGGNEVITLHNSPRWDPQNRYIYNTTP